MKIHDFIARLPTTNTRIAVTLLLTIGTAIRYWIDGWQPSWEWLAFLAAMAGLDVAQFTAKRKTHRKYADDGDA